MIENGLQVNNLTQHINLGLNKGYAHLNKAADNISQSLITNQDLTQAVTQSTTTNPTANPSGYRDSLNAPTKASLEQSLVSSVQTKTQLQALLKLLEVEKALFDQSLGKLFDQRA